MYALDHDARNYDRSDINCNASDGLTTQKGGPHPISSPFPGDSLQMKLCGNSLELLSVRDECLECVDPILAILLTRSFDIDRTITTQNSECTLLLSEKLAETEHTTYRRTQENKVRCRTRT
jgi:hypothetical protein